MPISKQDPKAEALNIDEYQRQDLRIKWLILLVTFLGFAGTIATIYIQFAAFNGQQKTQQQESANRAASDAEARANEYKKQFWEKQLDFFAEACQATGTITYTPVDSSEFKQASAKFEELCWGRLAIVESDDVARQMVAFRQALPKLLSAKSDEEQAAARERLQNISLDLAHQDKMTRLEDLQPTAAVRGILPDPRTRITATSSSPSIAALSLEMFLDTTSISRRTVSSSTFAALTSSLSSCVVRIPYEIASAASTVCCNAPAPDHFCCSHPWIETGSSGFRGLP
jgi:hypothetical protein